LAKLRDLYETPLAALPEASAPDLKNKSFTIALRKFLRTAQKAWFSRKAASPAGGASTCSRVSSLASTAMSRLTAIAWSPASRRRRWGYAGHGLQIRW